MDGGKTWHAAGVQPPCEDAAASKLALLIRSCPHCLAGDLTRRHRLLSRLPTAEEGPDASRVAVHYERFLEVSAAFVPNVDGTGCVAASSRKPCICVWPLQLRACPHAAAPGARRDGSLLHCIIGSDFPMPVPSRVCSSAVNAQISHACLVPAAAAGRLLCEGVPARLVSFAAHFASAAAALPYCLHACKPQGHLAKAMQASSAHPVEFQNDRILFCGCRFLGAEPETVLRGNVEEFVAYGFHSKASSVTAVVHWFLLSKVI